MRLNNMRHKNEVVMIGIFIVLMVLFSFLSTSFFSLTNIMNLFAQMVPLGLLTLGMAASMISGGMDLSIGALCSLCTVLCATFIGTQGMSPILALSLIFLISVLCGLFNGYVIGYIGVAPMLVTLGTQSLITSIGLVVSKGITVSIPVDRFSLLGRDRIGGVFPFQIIILLVAIAISVLFFNYTKAGRRIYLIGSNQQVAQYAGINVKRNIIYTYLFSAICGFAAGAVMASRFSSGRADIAAAQVLKAVSAAVFGGVSTMGGTGSMVGAMTGVAVVTLISNGMDMMNLSTYIQQISIGGMLLLVLAVRHARQSKG